MSACFKIAVVLGFLFSLMNFGTDIVSVHTWTKTTGDYESRADEMVEAIEADGTSNFQANSTWFMALSAEYDAASDFDKTNVYCDVITLQSKPDELYDDGQGVWMTSVIFIWMSGVSFVVGWVYLFWQLRKLSQECQDHTHVGGQKHAGGQKLECQGKKNINFQKREYMRYRTIAMFCAVGPMLAVNWLIASRLGASNGYECHEKFHDCGVAGSCTIGDLMVPVALNSSYLDLMTSNVLMMLAVATGIVDIVVTFMASLALFVRAADFQFIFLPFLVLALAVLPMVWLLFLDGLINGFATSSAILLVGHIPILGLILYACRGFMKEDSGEPWPMPQMTPDQIAEMNAEHRARMKRDCRYICCCMWCGPCCRPRARKPRQSQARKSGI